MPFEAQPGAFTNQDVGQAQLNDYLLHGASTSTGVNIGRPGRRMITYSGGALAIVLPAPVSGADDGKVISFKSDSDQAHTVTCTGHLKDGAGHTDVATFAAHAGAGFQATAFKGDWLVDFSIGITFS